MTLLVRLGILLLIGALGAFASYRMLWPQTTEPRSAIASSPSHAPATHAPPVGEYIAKSKSGSYRLALTSERKATLNFTDLKGKKHSYKGTVQEQKIVWTHTLRSKKWTLLEQPVDDAFQFTRPATIETQEGRFERVKK